MTGCEDLKSMLPEYWDGKLDEADRLIVEAHLERCSECREEAGRLGRLWAELGLLAGEIAPDPSMRLRFYDRLEAYRLGAAEGASKRARVIPMPGRKWLVPVGIAAAVAIGFFGGYSIDNRRDNNQISQLRGEVNNMRQLVALSLLQQQNASDRLQGVNWAYRVQQSDTEVLSALLDTVNHDPNVNVRLAAVDAMKKFSDSPVARRGLVQAVAKQDSPMVQIALIDQLVELKVAQAKPVLEGLKGDTGANPAVRQRAGWALGRID
jgi:hypothetical protein